MINWLSSFIDDHDEGITIAAMLAFVSIVGLVGFWVVRARNEYVQSTRTENVPQTVTIFKAWPESVTETHYDSNSKTTKTSTSHTYFIAVEYKNGDRETFAVDAYTYGLVNDGDTCTIDFYYILGYHSMENIRCGKR